MSVRAPVGDLNVAFEDCCIGRGLASISSSSKSFCLYLMKSRQPILNVYNGEGTVFGSINRKELYALQIYLPPKRQLDDLNERLYRFDKLIENNEREIRTLVALRNSLLPHLMSGKVDVANVELGELECHSPSK